VIAEAQNGSFCLLPHHIDFVAALAPGLLAYTTKTALSCSPRWPKVC
jgi:F-type H+-transporting ATPase subunit epsilon